MISSNHQEIYLIPISLLFLRAGRGDCDRALCGTGDEQRQVAKQGRIRGGDRGSASRQPDLNGASALAQSQHLQLCQRVRVKINYSFTSANNKYNQLYCLPLYEDHKTDKQQMLLADSAVNPSKAR